MVGASIGTGVLSALVPFVSAELYGLAVSTRAGPLLAVACTLALAGGQTGGKLLWYTSGRKGEERRRHRRSADPDSQAEERSRLAALARRLRSPRGSAALVFASGSLGVPPLALVSVAAGASRMRLRNFLLCCYVGRVVRFAVVMLPLALHR